MVEGTQFHGALVPEAKEVVFGALASSTSYYGMYDACSFKCQVSHSVSGASATTTLLPDSAVPQGNPGGTALRCYVTRLDVYVNGGNAASGGTGIEIRDSAGNVIAAFTTALLTANTGYSLPSADGTSGVTDNCIIGKLPPGANTGVGLQVFNNGAVTLGASSPITCYVEGYFAP